MPEAKATACSSAMPTSTNWWPAACRLSSVKPMTVGGACRDAYHAAVFFHLFQQIVCSQCPVVFSSLGFMPGFTRFDDEWCTIMPWFLVFFCRSVSLAFQGVDVYHDGVVDVFHLLECRDEASDVVALVYVQVIQSHGLEESCKDMCLAFT